MPWGFCPSIRLGAGYGRAPLGSDPLLENQPVGDARTLRAADPHSRQPPMPGDGGGASLFRTPRLRGSAARL